MEKRNEYMKTIEGKLIDCDAKLDKMKAKGAEVKSDMKAEYLSQMVRLEKKRDEFVVKYGQLKDSGGHAWDDIKVGTEKAWGELGDSIEKAESRFK